MAKIAALFLALSFCSLAYSKPAIPLLVKTPYLSTWLHDGSHLNNQWPVFWTGAIKGFEGLAHVDGKTYEIMGASHLPNILQAHQTDLKVTPTQSIFKMNAGNVEITINFFTPIDPTDLMRHSLPASYFAISAKSLDSAKHSVQVYFDISAEWVIGQGNANVNWKFSKLTNGTLNFDVHLKDPKGFQEIADLDDWSEVKFFTDSQAVTYQAGKDTDVRGKFASTGKLDDTIDQHYRAIDDNWPVFAFARDLGQVDATETAHHFYAIARVRTPAIRLHQGDIKALWEDYFGGSSDKMVEYVQSDAADALKRAAALDHKVITEAEAEGGASYVKIVSYALRQAYGGTEMVGTKDAPWMMLKEISSDGNCQTVDVMYPHFPVQYYLNPNMIKYLIDPIFDNQERGFWPKSYVIHDLGSSYPRCIGHIDGKEEAMEVEETANIIIMAAAYMKASKDTAYITKHYSTMVMWAKYLVDRGLYVGDQLTTDDFLGRLKNSTNLSVKAIIGLAAMAQIAQHAGHPDDAKHYNETAHSYIKTWEQLAVDKSGKHVKMSYNVDDSWFLLYNIYFDKLLETNVVPKHIFDIQDAFYQTKMEKYGIPLISTHKTTKNDWEMLAAAASDNTSVRKLFYDRLAAWISETDSNAPLSDYYDTVTGHSPMFINRPVVGSLFGPLALKQNKK